MTAEEAEEVYQPLCFDFVRYIAEGSLDDLRARFINDVGSCLYARFWPFRTKNSRKQEADYIAENTTLFDIRKSHADK